MEAYKQSSSRSHCKILYKIFGIVPLMKSPSPYLIWSHRILTEAPVKAAQTFSHMLLAYLYGTEALLTSTLLSSVSILLIKDLLSDPRKGLKALWLPLLCPSLCYGAV